VNKKTIIVILVIVAVLFLVFTGFGLYVAQSYMEDSDFSNCVVVEDNSHYIGKHLKYSSANTHETMKTVECMQIDKTIDGADGPEHGRVRWSVCPKGPDCEETGMN